MSDIRLWGIQKIIRMHLAVIALIIIESFLIFNIVVPAQQALQCQYHMHMYVDQKFM